MTDTMTCDYTTPITVKISSRVAKLVADDLLKYAHEAADKPDGPEWTEEKLTPLADEIKAEMVVVANTLKQIYELKTKERQPWTISLAQMRTAVTWIARVLTQWRIQQPNVDLSTIPDELADIAKDATNQIEKAGDKEFIQFLEGVSPGLMMERKHGIDPLQGTARFLNPQFPKIAENQ